MDSFIEILQKIALFFSVCVSIITVFRIFRDKPNVDVQIIEIKRDNVYLCIKLAFQNSGKKMSSAISYLLKSNTNEWKGLQEIKQEIYPTGHHSISRPTPKYVEAYPLELPDGKACHFSLYFKIDEANNDIALLDINLVNNSSKRLKLKIPQLEKH